MLAHRISSAYSGRIAAMLSSNVYRRKSDEFEHTPCFATVIDEVAWTALKSLKLTGRLPRPVSPAGDQPETGP